MSIMSLCSAQKDVLQKERCESLPSNLLHMFTYKFLCKITPSPHHPHFFLLVSNHSPRSYLTSDSPSESSPAVPSNSSRANPTHSEAFGYILLPRICLLNNFTLLFPYHYISTAFLRIQNLPTLLTSGRRNSPVCFNH